LTTEALRDVPEATMAELFRFVGVDPNVAPTAEVRRGRTEDKRVATALGIGASRWPGYDTVKRLLPRPLRTAVRRATTRPVAPAMAELPPDLEAELVDRLRPDVARLQAFLGTDFDGWGMLNSSSCATDGHGAATNIQ
jgi:hypothetical protein